MRGAWAGGEWEAGAMVVRRDMSCRRLGEWQEVGGSQPSQPPALALGQALGH